MFNQMAKIHVRNFFFFHPYYVRWMMYSHKVGKNGLFDWIIQFIKALVNHCTVYDKSEIISALAMKKYISWQSLLERIIN